MATATTNEPATSRLGAMVLAGGLMLAVMAGWVYANHEPAATAAAAVLGIAAGVGVLAGIGAIRSGASFATGAIAVGLGVVAAGCAAWLGFTYKLEAFGEAAGLALFAILAFGAAVEARCAGLSEENRWAKILSMRPTLGAAISLLGAVALGAFFYLSLIEKVGAPFAGELVGLLVAGFLLLFGGLYLFLSGDPPPTVAALRIFFVALGTLLGGVVMLVAIARGIAWNNDVFRAGVSAIAGPESWRFWLVAYLFLAGLGLAFASLNLAVSQVRNSPELRQATFGFGAAATGLLVLVLLGFVNLFAAKKIPYTFEWSKNSGLTALNAGSKNLLAGLSEPTSITIIMSPGNPLFSDVRNFAGNCQAYTNKISISYVDPKNEPRKYNELVTRFKEIDPEPEARSPFEPFGQGVLLVYGPLPEDVTRPVPHMFIPDRKLYDEQPVGRGQSKRIIKTESEIIRELAFLAKKSDKQTIYFLQDDGALDMNVATASTRRNPSYDLSRLGAGKLVDKLKKDNFVVKGVSFAVAPKDPPKDIAYLGSAAGDKAVNVPDDCDVLIIPGPINPIPRVGLDALERYMDRGGKTIAAIDVATDPRFTSLRKSGLEDFLKKYGVVATDQILFRAPQPPDQNSFGQYWTDVRVVRAEAPAKPATQLAKQFQGIPMLWWSCRVVKPGTSTKYQVEPLFVVNPRRSIVWADDNVGGLVDFDRYLNEIVRTRRIEKLRTPEPIPVAVTVTEGSGDAGKPRMVVFGDAEFLSNEDISGFETNYDVLAGAIEWMSERTFIGPRPKESTTYAMGPGADIRSMVWGAGWTMIVLIVVLGVGVWLARRK